MLRKDMTDEQAEAASLRRNVEVRIRRLRLALDVMERQALERLRDAEQGRGRYSAVAEVFVKDLAETIVNAGVEQLVRDATTVDICRAEDKTKQEQEARS